MRRSTQTRAASARSTAQIHRVHELSLGGRGDQRFGYERRQMLKLVGRRDTEFSGTAVWPACSAEEVRSRDRWAQQWLLPWLGEARGRLKQKMRRRAKAHRCATDQGISEPAKRRAWRAGIDMLSRSLKGVAPAEKTRAGAAHVRGQKLHSRGFGCAMVSRLLACLLACLPAQTVRRYPPIDMGDVCDTPRSRPLQDTWTQALVHL